MDKKGSKLFLLFSIFLFLALFSTSVMPRHAKSIYVNMSISRILVLSSFSTSYPAQVIAAETQTKAKNNEALRPVTFLSTIPRAGVTAAFIMALILLFEVFFLKLHRPRQPLNGYESMPEAQNGSTKSPQIDYQPPPPPKPIAVKQAGSRGLGIPADKIFTTVLLLLLLAVLPLALFLTRQRQEIRKRAEEPQCCSGTPECPAGQQCVRSDNATCNAQGKGLCQPQPGDLPGCCRDDNDCAPWEVCQDGNGACSTNKSCRSRAGCSRDSDCLPGNRCVGGTCVGSGTLECHATKDGVTVVNNTGQSLNCSGTYSACQSRRDSRQDCEANNRCSGGVSQTGNFALDVGASRSFGSIQPTCDAWQTDVQITCDHGFSCNNANNGCEWNDQLCVSPSTTPPSTPTPTVPSSTPTVPVSYDCQCDNVVADKTIVTEGDVITFTGYGWVSDPTDQIDSIRFFVKKGGVDRIAQTATAVRDASRDAGGRYYYQASFSYSAEEAGSDYSVSVVVHSVKLGWRPRG